MMFLRSALLLTVFAAGLSAETKIVLRKAGAAAAFEMPQLTVPAGERIIFSTPIVSGDVWLKDGHPIPDAFNPSFVIESAKPSDSGRYSVNYVSDDINESQTVVLTVVPMDGSNATQRLETFTTRGIAGEGVQSLITGFVVSEVPNQPSATKRILLRAVGPTLEEFGVVGFLSTPTLKVFDQSGKEYTSTTTNPTELASAQLRTGAFPLKPNAGDAVMLLTLPAGAYTAQVSSTGGASGLVVFDVYEVPPDR